MHDVDERDLVVEILDTIMMQSRCWNNLIARLIWLATHDSTQHTPNIAFNFMPLNDFLLRTSYHGTWKENGQTWGLPIMG